MTKIVRKPLGIKYVEKPMTFGEKLRNRRLELGLLQKNIADIFGVTEDSITNWENNYGLSQVRLYPKLIELLGYYPFNEECNSFGAKIRKHRYTHGLSHKKMGKLIGVDGSTICSWENNHTTPYSKILANVFWVIQNDAAPKQRYHL